MMNDGAERRSNILCYMVEDEAEKGLREEKVNVSNGSEWTRMGGGHAIAK